ncbi:regulatory signaling modulator protein AmpE [Celerinatantimonas sp. YJH-8]|uniref:regulatory signaling modulator protein AmpE n=1 Tax=Celerinatantimonas sp. YJH-8 TaxID=3228714 RepID=UPI0038C87290
MSLIAIVFALILERTRHYRSRWLWQEWSCQWFGWLPCKGSGSWLLFGVVLPTLLMAAVQWFIQGWLFGLCSLIVWVSVPLLTLGCPGLQLAFRDYIKSSPTNPKGACLSFNQRLAYLFPGTASLPLESQEQVGRFMCWLNFRYYFSIVFWFAIGGPALALCYGLLRSLQTWAIDHPNAACSVRLIAQLLHIIDWIPSRLSALSYVLCSRSTRGFQIWKQSITDHRHANAEWLGLIAQSCRGQSGDEMNSNAMIIHIVQLLKGSLLLSLVIIALLTLYGWLI